MGGRSRVTPLRALPDRPVAQRGLSRLARWYAARQQAVLFYSLLLTLAAAPVLTTLQRDGDLLELFLALNLSAAVLQVASPGRRRAAAAVILSAVLALRLVAEALDAPAMVAVVRALWTGLGLVGAANTLRFALRGRVVDAEHLYAALSAYLLAGVFCGVLYQVVSHAWPGAFSGGGVPIPLTFPSAIYFSFVTLATLGYGDIVPASDAARGIAVVEAVAGQLYVAVMIARLVSLYAGRERS